MKKSTVVESIDRLVTLPYASARVLSGDTSWRGPATFVASDPPGVQLGSGGGTVHLLASAWRASGGQTSFNDWLQASRKLLVHGGGESRRLPGYACLGKPLLPVPCSAHRFGQRPDETLLDLQAGSYERFFWHAPATYRVMVACGDVWIQNPHALPVLPAADILIAGISAPPEEACHHGVMFCPRDHESDLAFFLQKPSPDRIESLARDYVYSLDTGIWLLSMRAVRTLLALCGWGDEPPKAADGHPEAYELYSGFGLGLGASPSAVDDEVNALSCAVVDLSEGRFYHFGSNRSLMASMRDLLHPVSLRRSFGHDAGKPGASVQVLSSDVRCEIPEGADEIWIENSFIPETWTLRGGHVLTHIPVSEGVVVLDEGVCLDVVPLDGGTVSLRAYGIDDAFRGAVNDSETLWLGQSVTTWFRQRGLSLKEAGIPEDTDLQRAPLFPVFTGGDAIDGAFITWLTARDPAADAALGRQWLALPRRSAADLLQQADAARLMESRRTKLGTWFGGLDAPAWQRVCGRLDLRVTADLAADRGWDTPDAVDGAADRDATQVVHDRMFRSALARARGNAGAEDLEASAFELLREQMVTQLEGEPVQPRRDVLEDQIVWGRCPVRLDLAGGWTDTPPYCIEHGGSVTNLAVNLNGQPPIQVFGRFSDEPEIVIRSIDLGVDERITTFDKLCTYGELGSSFGIAKAALALVGLEPRFHAGVDHGSLRQCLMDDFGGGVELSMLAAVPKGSGLGTSSILAGTLLGTLSEMFGLRWSESELFARTSALEQMLTSGGGWQDQVGGLLRGAKRITTAPGMVQHPDIHWLPPSYFAPEYVNRLGLLYYTGLTRTAHDILGEIVKGMFLNDAERLRVIEEIGYNAGFTADAMQRHDYDTLCEAVRRSWQLNQRLDAGTNPPSVQAILDRVSDHLAACKLLGAGGGGYLLMLAKDEEAGDRIRAILADRPPNDRARFVDMHLSTTGFQATRS